VKVLLTSTLGPGPVSANQTTSVISQDSDKPTSLVIFINFTHPRVTITSFVRFGSFHDCDRDRYKCARP